MSEEVVYICNRCGDPFSLTESRTLYTDEGNETLCPNCGSCDIEEGRRCKVCRDIHYESDITAGVCKSCFNDAISAWKSCIAYLQPWEREVLEYEFGNLDITEK